MKRILWMAVVGVFLLSCGLAGCAINTTIGEEITPNKLATITKGKTTRSEIEAAFGQPSSMTLVPDGTFRAMYIYSEDKRSMNPSGFIPIVGMFNSGATQKNYMQGLTITYSSSGVVQDYAYMEHGQGSHIQNSVLSGAKMTPVSPR